MKTLKECLLNEVRLTIHNTKVVQKKKAFKDLQKGETIYYYWPVDNRLYKFELVEINKKFIEVERNGSERMGLPYNKGTILSGDKNSSMIVYTNYCIISTDQEEIENEVKWRGMYIKEFVDE